MEPIYDPILQRLRNDTANPATFSVPGSVRQTVYNVMDYGAKGNGIRLFGVVANTASPNVSCAGASFTQADVGKIAVVYTDSGIGNITTILSVIDGQNSILAVNAGITTISSTGYLIYGSDDSTAINAALTAAATQVTTANITDPNAPIGSGHVRVLLPGGSPDSFYLTASQLIIPSGIILDSQGSLANVLPSRNTPVMQINPYTVIERLEIENLYGTGVIAGTLQNQAHIIIKDIEVWHSLGSASAPSGLAGSPIGSGGTLTPKTRYYVVTAIDSTGGETLVSNEATVTTVGVGGVNSTTLTWNAFSGASSYRVYRGTSSGLQNLYYSSNTNSYTDTGAAAPASYPPLAPGFGLVLQGYHFELGRIYIKVATLGIYHNFGGDCPVDRAFVVGCKTGVRINGGGQIHYNSLLLDTCGTNAGIGSYGGVMIDYGSNINMDIQVFQNVAASNSLPQVVSIGNYNTNSAQPSVDIDLKIQANNTGGYGVNIRNVQDLRVRQLLSNTIFSAIDAITTAVVYVQDFAGEIEINGEYSVGITPSSGTQYGVHHYTQGKKELSTGNLLRSSTIIIAPSDSTDTAHADIVLTGTSDQTLINAAIASLPSNGAKVTILDGHVVVSNMILATAWGLWLEGQGHGTVITQANGTNIGSILQIGDSYKANIKVSNIHIEGNKANNTYGQGIYLNTPNESNSWVILENVSVFNCPNNGIAWGVNPGMSSHYLYNVHSAQNGGNGFYSPFNSGVGLTDSVFDSCIAETNALNGFYLATLDTHFSNCKSYFNGSAGGSVHGYYLMGYNNYFTGCEAQDNYGCGFFLGNGGDGMYGTQNNVFVNCDADSNNNTGNTRSASTANSPTGYGWYIYNTTGTQLIGCQAYVRPYPFAWEQVNGVYVTGTSTGTRIVGLTGAGNSNLLYLNDSSGVNYNLAGAQTTVLATGVTHTVDDVITALQGLGLFKQS